MRQFLLSLICLSQAQLLSRDCNIGCHRSGYDAGVFIKNRCFCGDYYLYETATGKKLTLQSKKVEEPEVKTVSVPSVIFRNYVERYED